LTFNAKAYLTDLTDRLGITILNLICILLITILFKFNIKISGELMPNQLRSKNAFQYIFSLIALLLMSHLSISMASAHGPKGHSDIEFTTLQAANKGMELYNKLLASGKIEESWETNLQSIEVLPRQIGEKREVVVKFSRSKGEPPSVYIFFTEKGEYSGSNFTGE